MTYNHAEPLVLEKDETLKVYVSMIWHEEDLMPHDYSVVVWAEKSPVQIESSHDHDSQTFPNFQLSDSVTLYGLDGKIIESVDDTSDALGLPILFESQDEVFEHGFQFRKGQYWVQTGIEAADEMTLSHQTSIKIDGKSFPFSGTVTLERKSKFEAIYTFNSEQKEFSVNLSGADIV